MAYANVSVTQPAMTINVAAMLIPKFKLNYLQPS